MVWIVLATLTFTAAMYAGVRFFAGSTEISNAAGFSQDAVAGESRAENIQWLAYSAFLLVASAACAGAAALGKGQMAGHHRTTSRRRRSTRKSASEPAGALDSATR